MTYEATIDLPLPIFWRLAGMPRDGTLAHAVWKSRTSRLF